MNNTIKLPDPQKELKFPLMQAFEMRRTKRRFEDSNLSDQELSNLLWAACGVTVKETKRSKSKRTAPSARNSQTMKIFVALDKGLFFYDDKNHCLIQIKENDVRKFITNQKMMQSAPVGLIYVSDFSKLKGYAGIDENRKWFVAGTETGCISQNVYLFCALANLSTALIGLVNREKLQEVMGLAENEKVVYTQTIGKSFDK